MEAPKVEENLPEKVEKKMMGTDSRGQVALVTLEDQLSFASKMMQQGLVSPTFKSPQQVVIAFQYAKAMGINEILALKLMYVVNERPCLYGEGPLMLCQRSGKVTLFEEFYLDEDGERISVQNKNLKSRAFAAVTRVKRKGDEAIQEDYFTLEDLARAKIDQSRNGKKEVWDRWERVMLRYKARAIALRSKFADLIAGIPIAEYDEHFSPEVPGIRNITPGKAIAAELDKTYMESDALGDVSGV